MSNDNVTTVTQLILHDRQGRDRLWWDQMRRQFWPDARVHLSWFEGTAHEHVDQSSSMNLGGAVSTHRLSPPIVHIAGDRAIAELPTVIEAPLSVGDVEAVLLSSLRIQYRAERRDGEWRLSLLDTIYERDRLVTTLPGATIDIDPQELARFRAPFRLLAWFLSTRGYEVLDDLVGEDRPEDVAAFYERERRWLAGH